MKIKLTIIFSSLLIAGCGTSDVTKNIDQSFSVSAQYGSMNGSWERASKDANEKALLFCGSMEKKIELIDERRDGVWGFSPQRAEVKFNCVTMENDIDEKTITNTELIERKLVNLKSIYEKGLISKKQYDSQVNKVLSSVK